MKIWTWILLLLLALVAAGIIYILLSGDVSSIGGSIPTPPSLPE